MTRGDGSFFTIRGGATGPVAPVAPVGPETREGEDEEGVVFNGTFDPVNPTPPVKSSDIVAEDPVQPSLEVLISLICSAVKGALIVLHILLTASGGLSIRTGGLRLLGGEAGADEEREEEGGAAGPVPP